MQDPPDASPTESAVGAAIRVAKLHGFEVGDPRVIGETNNVVVWLHPYDVLAKVGRRGHSSEGLVREHAAATELAPAGAPIAPPVRDAWPIVDDVTGFTVTLWQRLERDLHQDIAPAAVGESLRVLHSHLTRYQGALPDFRSHITRARSALDDDQAMIALSIPDRDTLRRTIDCLSSWLDGVRLSLRHLHGEPHLGNVLATTSGLRWIDLEDVCTGPVEWDLAFLPEEVTLQFRETDSEVLALLRILNSAVVATWCWARADIDGMLGHARYHLERVKAAFQDRPFA